MLEFALTSFTTFFATIGPVEAAVLFATLTPKMPGSERAAIAVRATIIASLLLLIFTLLGQPLLDELGVSIAALQTATHNLIDTLKAAAPDGRKTWGTPLP